MASRISHSFGNFSADICQLVFLQCSPFDLVSLAQLNKCTRNRIEDHKKTLFAAANNRLEVPEYPVYPTPSTFYQEWNSYSYAAFLFDDSSCSNCGQVNTEDYGTSFPVTKLLGLRISLHNNTCRQQFTSPRQQMVSTHRRYTSKWPSKKLRKDRAVYSTILPIDTTNLSEPSYRVRHLRAADSMHRLPIKPDASWYAAMKANQAICRRALALFEHWWAAYIKARQHIQRANMDFIKCRVTRYEWDIIVKTQSFNNLVRVFSRDLEALTRTVWRANEKQVLAEYHHMATVGVELLTRPVTGCVRCSELGGPSLTQHIRAKHFDIIPKYMRTVDLPSLQLKLARTAA